MAGDPRLAKAKRVLKKGLTAGKAAEDAAPNRATGTRARYKLGMRAAEEALGVLSEKA